MQDLRVISKHYAKALKNCAKDDKGLLEEIVLCFENLLEALKMPKLERVLFETHIPLNIKKEIVLEIVERIASQKVCLTLKPLLETMLKHNRLKALGFVVEELHSCSKQAVTLSARLLVQEKLESCQLQEVQQKLQERFNAPIEMTQDYWSENGVRLNVSSLDLEMSFSKESLLRKLEKQVIQSI
ncbi:F0F1 ATP synthase subunit delta [Helicobacter cetorum]|uniref:F0F1 ATP synthase subunit delta n=1 Tax=Helicobacter cetorum (strain ATCC BAA-540 / CCUG 52418 / MIT 99-5656) TaxID=1163745 RepID=I0EU44_HELCM|nr:F0F1 ATP synthase subunit delta [Helicobacter cetorum]AFI06463.1 F0F1 ATP synthase subunit delta [Helicobacter cetorum MIT 99-5656]